MKMRSFWTTWMMILVFVFQATYQPAFAQSVPTQTSTALVLANQGAQETSAFFQNLGSYSAYEILGVSRTATLEEIKVAYRKLAREYHPDVWGQKNRNADPILAKQAETVFKSIAAAYEILTDEVKRAKHDLDIEQKAKREVVENFYGPGKSWKPVSAVEGHAIGAAGFSGAIIAQSLIKSFASNDPAIVWAMKDSLKDPRTTATLISFGVWAQMAGAMATGQSALTQSAISKLPRMMNESAIRLQSFIRGKQLLTSSISMGFASMANRFTHKLLYAAGWSDLNRFHKEVEYWTDKELKSAGLSTEEWAKRAREAYQIRTDLQKLLSKETVIKNLIKNSPTKYAEELQRIQRDMIVYVDKYQDIESKYLVPARKARWEALAKVTHEAIALHPGEIGEMGLELSRLIATITALHYLPKFMSTAGKAVYEKTKLNSLVAKIKQTRLYEVLARDVVSKITRATREQLPTFIKLNHYFSIDGLLEADIAIKDGSLGGTEALGRKFAGKMGIWVKGVLKGSLHGLLFLTTDELIAKMASNSWQTGTLPSKLNKNLTEVPTQVQAFMAQAEKDNEAGKKIADSLKQLFADYSKTWDEYRDTIILPKFHEHYMAWNKKFQTNEFNYYRIYEYLNWLARGGRFSDPTFLENGTKTDRPAWHADQNVYSAFEEEMTVIQGYVTRLQPEVKLVRTEEGVDAPNLNAVIVNNYLLVQKNNLQETQDNETKLLQKSLKPILDELYFNKKTPGWVNAINWTANKSALVQSKMPFAPASMSPDNYGYVDAPYNLSDSFAQEILFLLNKSNLVTAQLSNTDLVKHLNALRAKVQSGQYKVNGTLNRDAVFADIDLLVKAAVVFKQETKSKIENETLVVDKNYLSNIMATALINALETTFNTNAGLKEQYDMMLNPVKSPEPADDATPAMSADDLIEELLSEETPS